jgi:hypothetical protein
MLFRLGVLLGVRLIATGGKAGLLDSVAGGWSFGFTGFVPPRGCELYVGGHNPGVVYRYNGSGWVPTWMRAATILQSLGSNIYASVRLSVPGWYSAGRYWGGVCGLWRYIRAGCLWGITTEGVELCWRSAWGACL